MAESENKTLIFVETKKRADELTMRMRREGLVNIIFNCNNNQLVNCSSELFLPFNVRAF